MAPACATTAAGPRPPGASASDARSCRPAAPAAGSTASRPTPTATTRARDPTRAPDTAAATPNSRPRRPRPGCAARTSTLRRPRSPPTSSQTAAATPDTVREPARRSRDRRIGPRRTPDSGSHPPRQPPAPLQRRRSAAGKVPRRSRRQCSSVRHPSARIDASVGVAGRRCPGAAQGSSGRRSDCDAVSAGSLRPFQAQGAEERPRAKCPSEERSGYWELGAAPWDERGTACGLERVMLESG